jgi:MATE family multidrug resistance protein
MNGRAAARRPAQRTGADGRAHVDVRAILRIAAPLMATNAIQAVLNLTDTWFIGRLSTQAVAAMGSIYWIMTCVIMVLGGVGLSVQAFVSQACGSGRLARASQAAWQALWAALATVPLFVLAGLGGSVLLSPFHLDPDVQALAIDYWQPRMFGAALGSMAWALMSFFNGIGATRVTLLAALLTVGANVPANQWLMFDRGLGIAGSAWGTNLAQLIGLCFALAVLLSRGYATRYRSRLTLRPRWQLIRQQLRVGFPVGVMYGADVLGVALLQLMIARVGTVPAAATQIVMMLTSVAYMPTLGMATAGTTLVGQAIGAGDRDWAGRLGNAVIALCAGQMAGTAVLLLLGGPWVLPLFLGSGDADAQATLAMALVLLWPAAAYQTFDGLYFGSSFCMRAAGDTRVPALTALGLSWLLFVPLAHFMVFRPGQAWIGGLPQLGLGALGGWLALMVYAMLLGSSMFLRWRTGRWRNMQIWRGNAAAGAVGSAARKASQRRENFQ